MIPPSSANAPSRPYWLSQIRDLAPEARGWGGVDGDTGAARGGIRAGEAHGADSLTGAEHAVHAPRNHRETEYLHLRTVGPRSALSVHGGIACLTRRRMASRLLLARIWVHARLDKKGTGWGGVCAGRWLGKTVPVSTRCRGNRVWLWHGGVLRVGVVRVPLRSEGTSSPRDSWHYYPRHSSEAATGIRLRTQGLTARYRQVPPPMGIILPRRGRVCRRETTRSAARRPTNLGGSGVSQPRRLSLLLVPGNGAPVGQAGVHGGTPRRGRQTARR